MHTTRYGKTLGGQSRWSRKGKRSRPKKKKEEKQEEENSTKQEEDCRLQTQTPSRPRIWIDSSLASGNQESCTPLTGREAGLHGGRSEERRLEWTGVDWLAGVGGQAGGWLVVETAIVRSIKVDERGRLQLQLQFLRWACASDDGLMGDRIGWGRRNRDVVADYGVIAGGRSASFPFVQVANSQWQACTWVLCMV